MSLTKEGAQAAGWVFDETFEVRTVQVTVPIYNASKWTGDTYQLKTSESEDLLLADITQWEQAQPTTAPAEPDPVSALAPDPPAEDEPSTETLAVDEALADEGVSTEGIPGQAGSDSDPNAAPVAATEPTPTEGA